MANCSIAQQSFTDSSVVLKEIEITATRLENFSSGTKIHKIDSTVQGIYKSTNLAALLENESPLFIKSYGLGSLATSSFRGGSAHHTAILWNGFNLNSPMNGQLDLSLIPNSFADEIKIQYGGTSVLWGSGAVGGAIHLNSIPKFNRGISYLIGNSFGSFSTYNQNFEFEISKERWISSVKIFHHSAKNDFEFYNPYFPDSSLKKQNNAELKNIGFLAENFFRINKNQKINFRFWYQNNNRNIPPSFLQITNRTNQKDEFFRFTSEWHKTGEKISFNARTAFFDEQLIYADYKTNEKYFNRSQTAIIEGETKYQVYKNHFVNAGINNTFSMAVTDGYTNKPQQNRTAAFTSYRINSSNEKIFTTFSARQEIIKNFAAYHPTAYYLLPATYSLGCEYKISKWISTKGNIAKVYRIPTFNDLFWTPGGNPNLLPESGYSKELGIFLKPFSEQSKISFSFEPTVFSRKMDNWIIWLPGENYWSPQNILQVWSRGMETHSELIFPVKKLKFKINVITNYVVSTNEKPISENDNSVDRQLIYVPMYSGHGKLSAEYKNFSFSCNQNYTGYRYTSTDNTEYMEPFMLTNIHASQKINWKKLTLHFFVQVNNLFNEKYQVISNRAMPLRNFYVGIILSH